VAKYLGDKILVYFGYPRAQEDDAERAVRSGLAIAEAVAALVPLTNVQLQAPVGIVIGTAVIGLVRRMIRGSNDDVREEENTPGRMVREDV
jgi:class 3 adenylate cyclase